MTLIQSLSFCTRPDVKILTGVEMIMRAVTVVFLALFILPVAAVGADQMAAGLDAALAKAITDWGVPGVAIVIVKDDQVVAAKGYGVRELGKLGKVDGETIFVFASLSKSFTVGAGGSCVTR